MLYYMKIAVKQKLPNSDCIVDWRMAMMVSGALYGRLKQPGSRTMSQVTIQTSATSKQAASRLLKELATSYRANQALQEIIADLTAYEQQYGLSTVQFYPRYIAGQLDDKSDFMVWASLYESYVDLDSGKEYAFFAGRCCVSQYKNIAYDQGMGFYAYMKNSSLCNSSPIMDRLPVNFVWIPKMPQSFSFRATDIDSDSLKYESIIPIAIGDKNSPKPRPELIIPSMVPPFDPSYIREVIYYPGYSLSAPFSSTTTLKLDSLSGQAVIDSGASVQNSKGKYLWCIKISEYKNNTLYGMTYTVINTEISPQCTTMAVPISEAALANIPTVSPNPFQNQIVINDLHGINSIEVYDLKGRLHQIVCTSSSKQTTILFNEAPSGLYLLRFVDAKGNIIASEKVVSE